MATDIELLAELLNQPTPQEIWALDGSAMLQDLGLDPDPWQVDLLRGPWKTDAGEPVSRAILLCSRQSGKSTVAGALALQTALLATPEKPALVLILSASGRQSKEFFKTKVLHPYQKLGRPEPAEAELTLSLELANGSRIISLPTSEDTIVGYSAVTLLIVDEAARVPDSLYKAVRPMLAIGGGRLVLLSTPRGKHGFFFEEWHGQGKWKRVRKTAADCPRITKEFLAEERLALQEAWFRQEYGCAFEALEGLVYPEFEGTIIDPRDIKVHRAWAGCDFGWNNPSAFVVVVSDSDDVLYVVEEIYGSRMTDEELAARAREACQRWRIERVYCDSAIPKAFRNFGWPMCRLSRRPSPWKMAFGL